MIEVTSAISGVAVAAIYQVMFGRPGSSDNGIKFFFFFLGLALIGLFLVNPVVCFTFFIGFAVIRSIFLGIWLVGYLGGGE